MNSGNRYIVVPANLVEVLHCRLGLHKGWFAISLEPIHSGCVRIRAALDCSCGRKEMLVLIGREPLNWPRLVEKLNRERSLHEMRVGGKLIELREKLLIGVPKP